MASTNRVTRIDVYSSGDMRALCERARQDFVSTADAFANLAAALEPRIVTQMRKEGIGGRHGMHLSSDEARAARTVTRHLLYIADCNMWAAASCSPAWRAWCQNVAEPIHQARALRSSGPTRDALKI